MRLPGVVASSLYQHPQQQRSSHQPPRQPRSTAFRATNRATKIAADWSRPSFSVPGSERQAATIHNDGSAPGDRPAPARSSGPLTSVMWRSAADIAPAHPPTHLVARGWIVRWEGLPGGGSVCPVAAHGGLAPRRGSSALSTRRRAGCPLRGLCRGHRARRCVVGARGWSRGAPTDP